MDSANRLAALFGRRRFAIKPGVERISALLERLGHPERRFKAIHIVGTNGKGSTAAFLSAILTAAGYRTGLFSSPHLVSYTERFQINGVEIDAPRLDELIALMLATATPDDTFFELTTALACCHFADNKVEWAVMEAGMGGRSDATSAVPANATVITPVALDHTQWLGSALHAIAAEKAGIVEPDTPVICAPQTAEVATVVKERCRRHNNRLLLADRDFSACWTADGSLRYQGITTLLTGLRPGIPGSFQCWNAASALAAAELLITNQPDSIDTALTQGIGNARWPGRMELFRGADGIDLLLDGAHNPAGAGALAESLLRDYGNRPIILVLGLMEDKDVAGILAPLLPLAHHVITVAPAQERSLAPERLAALCGGHAAAVHTAGSVADGIAAARTTAGSGDLIVVAGSLFTVGEARAFLSGQPCEAVRG